MTFTEAKNRSERNSEKLGSDELLGRRSLVLKYTPNEITKAASE